MAEQFVITVVQLFLKWECCVVSFAAIIRVVMQCFSPTSGGEALCDDPYNGCEGDWVL